ncbi:hypothetical protein LOAG_13151 [Loa loa]|uniref:Uncharacterized protein n=1 Tax=Loa loa TaxID=7209 RepID=A0A1S0TJW8_LOALO|nr:hypothetical protein LOAG_13151 [Loa loa]EFO15359.1 hypothetical protein LOAG_13151 [Loa loa]
MKKVRKRPPFRVGKPHEAMPMVKIKSAKEEKMEIKSAAADDQDKKAKLDDDEKMEMKSATMDDRDKYELKDDDEKDEVEIGIENKDINQESKESAVETQTKASTTESGIKATVCSSEETGILTGTEEMVGAGKGSEDSSGTGNMGYIASRRGAWETESTGGGGGRGQKNAYFMPGQGFEAGGRGGAIAAKAGLRQEEAGNEVPISSPAKVLEREAQLELELAL